MHSRMRALTAAALLAGAVTVLPAPRRRQPAAWSR